MEIDLKRHHFLLNIAIRSLSQVAFWANLSLSTISKALLQQSNTQVSLHSSRQMGQFHSILSYDTPPLMPMPGRFRNFFTSGSCAASNASPTQPTALETMAAEIGWADFLTRKKSPTWYDLRLHSETALTSYDLWPMVCLLDSLFALPIWAKSHLHSSCHL